MLDAFTENRIFGILITLLVYGMAQKIYVRYKHPLLNPFVVSLLTLLFFILGFRIPLSHYMSGAAYLLSMLPVTVILLALPLYRQRSALRKERLAILMGISAGIITSLISTILLCRLFDVDLLVLKSLIPRSITTPLGLMMAENLGAIESITGIAIIFNGISGVLLYAPVYTLFRITHPVARGVAMGTTSHAIGTAKALELGEVTGAMSSLAIVISGLLTVAATPLVKLILK